MSRTNKPDKTGRNQGKRHVRLDHDVMDTVAYRSLSPNSRSLLFEIIKRFNGSNNGSLWLSVRDAAALMGVADHKSATAAFGELQTMGFIKMTADAHFSVKTSETSRARCWRLTWQAVSSVSRGPTHEYRSCEPVTEKAKRRASDGLAAISRWRREVKQNRFPVVDSSTMKASMDGFQVIAVVDSSTVNPANDAFPSPPVVVDSSTHISTRSWDRSFWWKSDAELRVALFAEALRIAAQSPERLAA